jgi:DNA-binding response OmpR family regulator
MRVLVLDDDPDVRRSVARFLRHAGYVVDEADDLATADEKLAITEYDAAVLDRTVPGGDSIDLLARLRASGGDVPVVFLTGLDGVPARVEGLGAGADDYLVKPFAMDELVARVHALTRRARGIGTTSVVCVGDVEIDTARSEARRAGNVIDLTAKEYVLLRYLMANAGAVVSRTDLIEHCWDELADPMSNVVDVRIGALRRKLGQPPIVHTVRGHGYLLEARDQPDEMLTPASPSDANDR